jgi:hypothetical protein
MRATRATAAILLLQACSPGEIKDFSDTFDRASLGADWLDTGDRYRIVGGEIVVSRAYNHPLWLRPRLPRDAEITFDVRSQSPDGDIKVEAWGDGESAATDRGAYTATGYVFIFGGWKNRLTVLARMDEHGADRKARGDLKVVPGRKYSFRIVRKERRLSWWIDAQPVFELDDPSPLEGPGHEHFGLNDWEAQLHFDNLRVRAQ